MIWIALSVLIGLFSVGLCYVAWNLKRWDAEAILGHPEVQASLKDQASTRTA